MRQFGGIARHQTPVQHLTGGIGEVGQLQQQEAFKEVPADAVKADHCRPRYSHHRRYQRPGVEAPVKGVLNQCHVQRREDGEQQDFGHREHAKAQVQTDVGDAELQGTDQQHAAHETGFHLAPAGQRDKHQPGQYHPHQHCKVAVDVSSQILTNQAEGKRLNQRHN